MDTVQVICRVASIAVGNCKHKTIKHRFQIQTRDKTSRSQPQGKKKAGARVAKTEQSNSFDDTGANRIGSAFTLDHSSDVGSLPSIPIYYSVSVRQELTSNPLCTDACCYCVGGCGIKIRHQSDLKSFLELFEVCVSFKMSRDIPLVVAPLWDRLV